MWNWLKNIAKTFTSENESDKTVAAILPVSSQAHVATPAVVITPAIDKPKRVKKDTKPASTVTAPDAKASVTVTKKPVRRTAKRTPPKKITE